MEPGMRQTRSTGRITGRKDRPCLDFSRRAATLVALLVGMNACWKGQPDQAEPPPDPRFVERLRTPQEFAALQGEGWSVKYLGAVDGRQPLAPLDRRCVFQDTAMFSLHLQFLRSFPPLAQ